MVLFLDFLGIFLQNLFFLLSLRFDSFFFYFALCHCIFSQLFQIVLQLVNKKLKFFNVLFDSLGDDGLGGGEMVNEVCPICKLPLLGWLIYGFLVEDVDVRH